MGGAVIGPRLPKLLQHFLPVLVDSLMGICEWVSDSREFVWLANPCELRTRIAYLLCPHHVGSAYGKAIRTISRRLVKHCRIRANPLGLRIRIMVQPCREAFPPPPEPEQRVIYNHPWNTPKYQTCLSSK